MCNRFVDDVTYLSKCMVRGAVVEYFISVYLSESLILGGICGVWDGTWEPKKLIEFWM